MYGVELLIEERRRRQDPSSNRIECPEEEDVP